MLGLRPRRHWGHRGHWEPPDQKAVTQNPPFNNREDRIVLPQPPSFSFPQKKEIFSLEESHQNQNKNFVKHSSILYHSELFPHWGSPRLSLASL